MRRTRSDDAEHQVRSAEEPGASGSRRSIPAWLEGIVLLAVALGLALLIKTFLVQMFFVPSESMEPGLLVNDRIMVEKWSTWDSPVQRGDVVVFEDPGGWLGAPPALNPLQKALSTIGLYPTGGHLVKRVIGVGGDTVACCDEQGRVTVNGAALQERPYIKRGAAPSSLEFKVKVPPGRLWMMGDNRADSEDSRYHPKLPGKGSVPESAVVGKVWAVVWPLGRWGRLESPDTFNQSGLSQK